MNEQNTVIRFHSNTLPPLSTVDEHGDFAAPLYWNTCVPFRAVPPYLCMGRTCGAAEQTYEQGKITYRTCLGEQ